MRYGKHTLAVRSVDRAGNLGPIKRYEFKVGNGTAPVGEWLLTEGTGTVAKDSTQAPTPHDLTLSGGASWAPAGTTDSRVLNGPPALRLDGASGVAKTAAGQTVIDTSKSFSVAAWVRPTVGTTNAVQPRTVLGVDSTKANPFGLSLSVDGAWSLWTRPNEDSGPNAEVKGGSVNLGTWTQLIGMYDSGTRQITLYVNGAAVGTTTLTAPLYKGTGPLVVGRYQWAGSGAGFFGGDVSEVRGWDRLLTADEVDEMVRTPVQQAWWSLDSDGSDDSGNNRPVTTAGGAAFSGGVLALDGVDDHAKTAGPVLRTDQSYSIAAWVKLDRKSVNDLAVVSQFGNRGSAFWLQYRGSTDRWAMGLGQQDSDTTAITYAQADQPARLGTWTHLVGEYDAGAHKIRLYVDGVLQQQVADFTASWNATGPMYVGRSQYAGTYPNYFPGQIDDVQVFSGVLPGQPTRPGYSVQSIINEGPRGTSPRVVKTGKRKDIFAYQNKAGAASVLRLPWSTDTIQGAPVEVWSSAGYAGATTKAVTGDFNGDGRPDVALLRDAGGSEWRSTLLVGNADGSVTAQPETAHGLVSGWGLQLMAGDVDADGRDDLILYHNAGANNMYLLVLPSKADGTGFGAVTYGYSMSDGTWDYSKAKVVAGDFNGDGATDVAAIYDRGNAQITIFVFRSTTTGFVRYVEHETAPGNWEASRSQWTVGDINGDGLDDLVAIYDYGSATVRYFGWTSKGGSWTVASWWLSGVGMWDPARTKLITGDVKPDGKADVVAFYRYQNNIGVLALDSDGAALSNGYHRVDLASTYDWYQITPL
ncbi:LamG-like jellyroll fold domain-containing protein [Longispora sp. K20-0274]|uniref:LamG-like jellyroll fold domain-containing protein n=1 Tax=Longispora sp. K20-0274 TaxID=3088255 RepID=UPI00399BBC75